MSTFSYNPSLHDFYGSFPGVGYDEKFYEDTGTGAISNPVQLYDSLVNEQVAMNQLQMDREDSSYQRMVEDMRKAGLNPWTGVASGGSSSSSYTSPHSSALGGLLDILGYNVDRTNKRNKQFTDSIRTGASVAFGILSMLF